MSRGPHSYRALYGYSPFRPAGRGGVGGGGDTQEAFSTEVLADSPTGFWKLDETSGTGVTDSSGNENSLTHGSGVTVGGAGPFTGAGSAAYDGTINGQSAGSPVLGTDNLTSYTIEAWVKSTGATVSGRQQLVAQTAQNSSNHGNLATSYYTSRETSMDEFPPSGTSFVLAAVPLVEDVWSHIVFIKDGGSTERRIWIDGIKYTTASVETYTGDAVTEFILGAYSNNVGYFNLFEGELSNVAVYDTALSDARVEAHFAAVNTELVWLNYAHRYNSVALFKFAPDELLINSSEASGALDATVNVNTTEITAPADMANALEFDGSTSYITCPNYAAMNDLNTIGQWMSLEIIYRIPSGLSGSQVVVGKGEVGALGGQGGWLIYFNPTDGTIYSYFGRPNTQQQWRTPFAVALDTWIHAVFVTELKDGTFNKWYYENGVSNVGAQINLGSGTPVAETEVLAVGAKFKGAGPASAFADVDIAGVALYDYEITLAQSGALARAAGFV